MTSRRCMACGRILTDPTSVARGYGPECHAKIRGATKATREDGTEITIVDAKLAGKSRLALMKAVGRALARLRSAGTPALCRSCGEPLMAGYVDVRDHRGAGGIRIPGYGSDLWAVIRCSECRHELSVWKIGVTQDEIDDELDRQRRYKKRSLAGRIEARVEGRR